MARALRLNEDLAEAVALVHDLGHTPFGHSGEDTLNEIMKDHGGFEHNRQTLRVVDFLEEKYPEFPGLNLTYEVRESIIKHHTIYDKPIPHEFQPKKRPTLECQVVCLADEIAFNCHDVDDGLRSGVLLEDELDEISLWKECIDELSKKYSKLTSYQRQSQCVRRMINRLVTDVISATSTKIKMKGIKTVEDVRNAGEDMVTFSSPTSRLNTQLKMFLFNKMYQHYRMIRMGDKAKRMITQLFEVYLGNPDQLPPHFRAKIKESDKMQVICDYIAGMTDRYALQEYKKLFDPLERV
jgi:dGTPase